MGKKMPVAYVAGPVRNKSLYERQQNVLRGEAVAYELWAMGIAAICPHKNCEFLDGKADDDTIIAGDLCIISKCDIVVIIPGWEKSEGTRQERQHCLTNDIPIFYWGDFNDRANLRALVWGAYDLKLHVAIQRKRHSEEIEGWQNAA